MEEPMESPPEYDRIQAVMTSARTAAPAALRERVAAERDRTLVRRTVVKRMKLTGVMAGAAAALGVAVGLVAPAGHSSAPSPLAAAALATRGAVAGAPQRDLAHPHLLRVAVDGVPFPRWEERSPWRPSGQRADAIGGRTALTVYYDDPRGVRLGYTILDGAALAWPEGARRVVRNGVEVRVIRGHGRVAAFWRVHGHSCIISAPDTVPDGRMIALASARTYVS